VLLSSASYFYEKTSSGGTLLQAELGGFILLFSDFTMMYQGDFEALHAINRELHINSNSSFLSLI